MQSSVGTTSMGTAIVDLAAITHNLRVVTDVAGWVRSPS